MLTFTLLVVQPLFIGYPENSLLKLHGQVELDVSILPFHVKVYQGGYAIYNVSVTGSPDIKVELWVLGLPIGATYTFSKNKFNPPFTSQLEIHVPPDLPIGNYSFRVRASDGGLADESRAILEVVKLVGFNLSISPQTGTVNQGEAFSFVITVSDIGGFQGEVDLRVFGLPRDSSYVFSVNNLKPPFNSVLTIFTEGRTPVGEYTLKIKGTGKGKIQESQVTLIVKSKKDFEISVSPRELTLKQASKARFLVQIIPIEGFSGNVILRVLGLPNDAKYEVVSKKTLSGGVVQIEVEVETGQTTGTYNVVFRGEYGEMVHTDKVVITIVKAKAALGDFALLINPYSGETRQGGSFSADLMVKRLGEYKSTVTLSAENVPEEVKVAFNPSFGVPDYNSTLRFLADEKAAPGTYIINVTATGSDGKIHSIPFILTIVGKGEAGKEEFIFSISVTPKTLKIDQGGTTVLTVKVKSVSGEPLPVKLSVTGLPSDANYKFDPPEVKPNGSSTLTINTGVSTGVFTLLIKGRDGGKEQGTVATLVVEERRCFIATATYGSELSEEVKFLRRFREEIILSSFAGKQFMEVFNSFYYSFSPNVAQFILKNQWLKPVFKAFLLPLITALHIAASISIPLSNMDIELGALAAGLTTSFLLGLLYFLPLMIPLRKSLSGRVKVNGEIVSLAVLTSWLLSMVLTVLGEIFTSQVILMLSTFLLVSSTVVLTVISGLNFLDKVLNKFVSS